VLINTATGEFLAEKKKRKERGKDGKKTTKTVVGIPGSRIISGMTSHTCAQRVFRILFDKPMEGPPDRVQKIGDHEVFYLQKDSFPSLGIEGSNNVEWIPKDSNEVSRFCANAIAAAPPQQNA
jgi:hypothetical protein